MTAVFLVVSVFLACAVEAVEALTIVLAMGVSRGWRSTLQGAASGLAVLGVIVAALGPALTRLPLDALRLVVGGLLLVFGLQWLRKAVLRAGGFKAVHDEEAIYARHIAEAGAAGEGGRAGVRDWYAFALSFKGVLLEGLEVVFIVLTFGANQGSVPLAALGALAAVGVVVTAGVAVRAPLARVPENTMKFVVAVMLTSFGCFWGAEGAGAHWPGGDAALPVVLGFVTAVSLGAVRLLRTERARRAEKPPAGAGTAEVG
ncbi:COG4280 domain-containing protein [Streptomyces sp. NPDC049040]|uniref:COG4280 domain-containing protein n=1 Tax=Streptomyces sp. NPDC049040 TaxID=3365593 RepID=UPI00371C4EDD